MAEVKPSEAKKDDHLVKDEEPLTKITPTKAEESNKDNKDNGDEKSDDDQLENEDTCYDPVEKHQGMGLPTLEDEEDELLSLPAKLFRYDITSKEWKERGTGNMRFLKHRQTKKVRLIMRRKRVGKLCSNHYITAEMNLKPHSGSNKSYIWTTAADMSDGTPSQELLAIRFSKVEEADEFKSKFEEVQKDIKKDLKEPPKSS